MAQAASRGSNVTRTHRLSAALAGLFALSVAGAAFGDDQEVNLFISPCGEPFTAPQSEPYPVVKWFNKVDANGDGKVDKAEFTANAEAFFKRLDRNGDDVLTSDEIYIYEHQIVPVILNQGQASIRSGLIRVSLQAGPGGMDSTLPSESYTLPGGSSDSHDSGDAPPAKENPIQGAAFFSLFADPEPVMSADRNFDFKISHKEFIDQSNRRFAQLDKDGKGYFVLADLPRTPAEIFAHAKRTASR